VLVVFPLRALDCLRQCLLEALEEAIALAFGLRLIVKVHPVKSPLTRLIWHFLPVGALAEKLGGINCFIHAFLRVGKAVDVLEFFQALIDEASVSLAELQDWAILELAKSFMLLTVWLHEAIH